MIVEFFRETLANNEFAQGGIVVATTSGLMFALRQIPSRVITFLRRRTTCNIEVDDNQVLLWWLLAWLGNSDYGKTTKRVAYNDGSLGIGPGFHWFFQDRRLFLVNYSRELTEQGHLNQKLTVNVIPGSRKTADSLVADAKEAHMSGNKDTVGVFHARIHGWSERGRKEKRPLESVVLKPDARDSVTDALDRFQGQKDLCSQFDIPWRLGFLFHGEPGNGKTSLATSIASSLGYDLYILNLRGFLSDDQLLERCSEVGERCVLLVEDIDAFNVQRDPGEGSGITLSGLLNALDGVTTENGRITVLTTNNIGSLDEAIIRSGRVDVKVELTAPDRSQLQELFERFEVPYEGQEFKNMADAQGYLLRRIGKTVTTPVS